MKTVLVIEDEPQIRGNIQDILELSGFKTLLADNGLLGLQMLKADQPDLVICDVMMPELDGFEVVAAIRQDPTTEGIPVIFLTARVDRSDLRQGMELGADDYLTKPFTPEELLKAVEARLTRLERVNQMRWQYERERQQTAKLKLDVQTHQQKLQESQHLAAIRDEVLQRLSRDLRNPLSNINMAIHMLKEARSQTERDRYLAILQAECSREIDLLNEIENLQVLLTPENAKVLQKFNLLHQSR